MVEKFTVYHIVSFLSSVYTNYSILNLSNDISMYVLSNFCLQNVIMKLINLIFYNSIFTLSPKLKVTN